MSRQSNQEPLAAIHPDTIARESKIENCLRSILEICMESGTDVASTGAIATRLGVSDPTASRAIRTLAEAGLAEFSSYYGASLTPDGRLLAMRVLRRRRLIESLLVNVLKMKWDEVDREAMLLEHAVSEKLADVIDEFLGRPTTDPHGDPIPRFDGTVPEQALLPLDQCNEGTHFVVGRVVDQSDTVLQYLDEVGIRIGTVGQLCTKCLQAEFISIQIDGKVIKLGQSAAGTILVSQRQRHRAILNQDASEPTRS